MQKILLIIIFTTTTILQPFAQTFVKFSNVITSGTSLNAAFTGQNGWTEVYDSNLRIQKPFTENLIGTSSFIYKRPQVLEASFTKDADKNSPLIESLVHNGETIDKIEMVYAKVLGQGNTQEYMRTEYEGAVITNIARQNAQEIISFIYTKITVKYKRQNPNTGQFETEIIFSKDFSL